MDDELQMLRKRIEVAEMRKRALALEKKLDGRSEPVEVAEEREVEIVEERSEQERGAQVDAQLVTGVEAQSAPAIPPSRPTAPSRTSAGGTSSSQNQVCPQGSNQNHQSSMHHQDPPQIRQNFQNRERSASLDQVSLDQNLQNRRNTVFPQVTHRQSLVRPQGPHQNRPQGPHQNRGSSNVAEGPHRRR